MNMFKTECMSKSQATRDKISGIAIQSFRDRGYEQTTLRLIAAEADVSVGNAYYYFPTKNHLVQELYVRVQEEHRARAEPRLESVEGLAPRLVIALETGLRTLEPYHSSASGFLAAAISPTSAVNPLSEGSTAARELAVSLFRDVVEGSTTALPARLKTALPELLWFAYLGLALYWVYDQSPGQGKSRVLLRRSCALFGTVLPLLRLPFVRGPLDEALDIVEEARA